MMLTCDPTMTSDTDLTCIMIQVRRQLRRLSSGRRRHPITTRRNQSDCLATRTDRREIMWRRSSETIGRPRRNQPLLTRNYVRCRRYDVISNTVKMRICGLHLCDEMAKICCHSQSSPNVLLKIRLPQICIKTCLLTGWCDVPC